MKIQCVDEDTAATAAAFFHDRLEDTFSKTFPPKAIKSYRESHTADELRDRADDDGYDAVAMMGGGGNSGHTIRQPAQRRRRPYRVGRRSSRHPQGRYWHFATGNGVRPIPSYGRPQSGAVHGDN
jgi:hypothetical protein